MAHGSMAAVPDFSVETVDLAVIGADVTGLAVALAAARAHPGASIALYDTAAGPPPSRDGGALLSVNGLRALRAIDAPLCSRLTSELSSPVHEALWFDLEGELLRRTPLGLPSAATAGGGRSRRRSGMLRRGAPPASSAHQEPDPSAPPLVVGLHELREALSDALPPEIEIFGRHHLRSVEACPSGGALLHFAASPSGPPVRCVHARLVVGTDGPDSALKRLQFDDTASQQPQPSGRAVWRGRFTLRPRDPDFARLRSFTTATRTWIDLRAPPGAERSATLAPAGPNTFVWSASCPASMLPARGLQDAPTARGASPYWRCLAMFEDFSQDFFAVLRATAASAVTEYDAVRPPSRDAAAGLAAPWRWSAGPAALAGEAVYGMSSDDAASTAVNLALEDAAVLGACVAAHGVSPRALQEYARQRGPRVSGLLSLPPSAPERTKLRDAPFLTPTAAPSPSESSSPSASELTKEQGVESPVVASLRAESMADTVKEAVDKAAAASVPAPPTVAEILAKGAAATPPSASTGVSRPSGGASRTAAPGSGSGLDDASTSASGSAAVPAGPSSPLFSRPSGARRLGPVPSAIAAVAGLLAVTGQPASHPVTPAAAEAADDGAAAAASEVTASQQLSYSAGATPQTVWEALLRSSRDLDGASSAAASSEAAAAVSTVASAVAAAHSRPAVHYCSARTPAAVWQALLVAPATAHSVLATQPYSAGESPALVWSALLGGSRDGPSAAATGSGDSVASAAPAVATAAEVPSSSLLPRPVPRPAPTMAIATAGSVPSTSAAPTEQNANPRDATPEGSDAPPPQRAATAGAGQVRKERRARGHASTAAAASTSSRRGGNASSKRPTSKSSSSRVAGRAGSKADAASAAAKAAATMTVSLGAAAALGGVISAGGGHVPVDVASALHVHGAVAQFWDDLNNLTLSSTSMSSIDV